MEDREQKIRDLAHRVFGRTLAALTASRTGIGRRLRRLSARRKGRQAISSRALTLNCRPAGRPNLPSPSVATSSAQTSSGNAAHPHPRCTGGQHG